MGSSCATVSADHACSACSLEREISFFACSAGLDCDDFFDAFALLDFALDGALLCFLSALMESISM